MFYLTIPLAIALLALAGLAFMVWKKMPFLRKMTPESHEMGQTWMHDMAPEAVDWFRAFPWRRSMHNVLVEFEKLIRQGRLLMSAVDRASERLVRGVRRVHQETAKEVIRHEEALQAAHEEAEQEPEEIDMDDPDQLRQEEQRLIVAIAQNPKDATLYSELARVYMKLQNYADAVEALKAALKLDPENATLAKRLESAQKRLATQTPAV